MLDPYGAVPKGPSTFLGSLYKEVAKTTSGTLVYRFKRQTARKKYFFLWKTLCPQFRIGFYLRDLQIAAFGNLMSYLMESKPKKSINRWWHVNAVTIETVEALETRYSVLHHPKWIECDLLKPIALSLSSHMIQLVQHHWKDPQTSQENKNPEICQKCPTGTKLHIA